MAEDKPFGWRPLTDEQREEYRASGFDDAGIARMEAGNVYQPIPLAVISFELAGAIMVAAIRRLGADFAHDIRRELERRVGKNEVSEHVEDHVEARIIRQFLDDSDWEAVIARATATEG